MQEEEIQAIKEGFEAKYPQITMNYFFAGTNKVLTKLATEMQSGEIAADLVWTGAPSDYRKLKENRYLSPISRRRPSISTRPSWMSTITTSADG